MTLTLRHPSECKLGRSAFGGTIPYTVQQVVTMSGVSVRTLGFYYDLGLLKSAFYGTNGYRLYEQAQLLMLQQIRFYRELGFDLYQIANFMVSVLLMSTNQSKE